MYVAATKPLPHTTLNVVVGLHNVAVALEEPLSYRFCTELHQSTNIKSFNISQTYPLSHINTYTYTFKYIHIHTNIHINEQTLQH